MEITTIMYPDESINQKPDRASNPAFQEFLDCIKNPHTCHALPCIASLAKFLHQLDYI